MKIYGIRHHGVGSAKALTQSLKLQKPDCIAIELPSDSQEIIPFLKNKKIKLPIAIMIYNANNTNQASFIPFVRYSPEWIAIKYGLKHQIPIHCIDLPLGISFANKIKDTIPPDIKKIQSDPLKQLAAIAGYSDIERWWEVYIEEPNPTGQLFYTIDQMMTTLRSKEHQTSASNQIREAYMRQQISKLILNGYNNIATICGAWHLPALKNPPIAHNEPAPKNLTKLKTAKTIATLVPWSYERMTIQGGYSAGIDSPAWYETLHSQKNNADIYWMTKAARLLRSKDLEGATSEIIQGVQLAHSLAQIKRLERPGILELKKSAQTVFGRGSLTSLKLIEQQLIVGKKVGAVPSDIPTLPIVKDLEKRIKATRLTAYQNSIDTHWLKATASNKRGGLDLRKSADRKKSILLHQLNILDLNWGTVQAITGREESTFREYWKLKWKISFPLKLIQASQLGLTIESAATNNIINKANSTKKISDLASLLVQAIHAELDKPIDTLLTEINNRIAKSYDVEELLDLLVPLSSAYTFGSVRDSDKSTLKAILIELYPRIFISLPQYSNNLSNELAEILALRIKAANYALSVIQLSSLEKQWLYTLQKLMAGNAIHNKIRGLVTRLLFDKRSIDLDNVQKQLSRAMSFSQKPQYVVDWLSGFLGSNGLLLIHHQELIKLIDQWLEAIPWFQFDRILPAMRKIFSDFDPNIRKKILASINSNSISTYAKQNTIDKPKLSIIKPVVDLLLSGKL